MKSNQPARQLILGIRRRGTRVDRLAFSTLLRQAILGAWDEFVLAQPADHPYAFTLIGGQVGNYLGYAVATEEGLLRVAADYETRGYRYQGWEWENFDNCEKLAVWLRWANPDDGWRYGDFPKNFEVQAALAQLVKTGAIGQDPEGFEEFCTDVLTSLQQERAWQPWSGRVVVGFTYGEDPRDFLRTATRANPYPLVQKLWGEHWQGEELSRRIPAPK
jgi:hypothetical protein